MKPWLPDRSMTRSRLKPACCLVGGGPPLSQLGMAALALARLLSGGSSPAESQLQVASGHSGSSGGGSFQKILLWEAMAKDNYSPVLVLVAENGLDPWINQGCHDLLTGSWQGVNLPQYAQPDYDFRPRRSQSGYCAGLPLLSGSGQASTLPEQSPRRAWSGDRPMGRGYTCCWWHHGRSGADREHQGP